MSYFFPHPDAALGWPRWVTEAISLNQNFPGQIGFDAQAPWQDFASRLSLFVPETPQPQLFESWQAWVAALKLATGSGA
jgi:hypothetical protein